MEQTKFKTCRYRKPFIRKDEKNGIGVVYKCMHQNRKFEETILDEYGKEQNYPYVCERDCENCELYKNKYIEWPIEVNNVDLNNDRIKDGYNHKDCGKYVGVRICEDGNDKTYLGIYLGDFVIENSLNYHSQEKTLNILPLTNPTIFVPELNRIVFGMESFWYELESPEDLKEITNEDINNVWYVQALKSFCEESGESAI